MRKQHAAWLALMLPAAAAAHPFATRTAGHRLHIDVGLDLIGVDYTVEAPFAGHDDPTSTARTLDVQTLDEVTSGIVVLVDGVAVPLRLDPDRRPRVRATSDSATLRVWMLADAPKADEAAIVVSNGNYPDLAGQFWTDASIDAQVVVRATNLLPDGPDGIGLQGRWRTDEDARTTEVRVRFRRGAPDAAWHALWGTEGLSRPLVDATRPSLPGSARFVLLGTGAAVAATLVAWLWSWWRARARTDARVHGPP